MSIKHAILGLLSEQPMHGYRLKDIFDERVSPMWGLTTAQIYQTLSALERAGLLQSRGERVGSRPERRIYELTDAGEHELLAWLQEPPSASMRPFRADLLLRLMFLREDDVARLRRTLDRQEHEALHLYTRVTQMPRSCTAADGVDVDILGLFLDGMAHHLDADLKILRRCRDEIERWSKARNIAVPGPTAPPITDAPPNQREPLGSETPVRSSAGGRHRSGPVPRLASHGSRTARERRLSNRR
jgi:DNA-binding PadR family transcriptional regulator